MESFDILDKDGCSSGLIANKGEDLLKGQYYLGVHAYIYNDKGEFLLQQRSRNKEFLPLGWDIHMGHVLAGESSEEAIRREVFEEIGIKVDEINHMDRVVWEVHNHMIDIYTIQQDINIKDTVLQASEVEAIKYVSKDEMLALVDKMDYRPHEYRKRIKSFINEI